MSPFYRRHRLAIRSVCLPILALLLCHCSSTSTSTPQADVIVSVKDQRIGLYKNGNLALSYKVSTSKFGVGDKPGSCCTPLGKHEVIAKIGHGLPKGAVLHSRQWSGEVLKPNAPGRDPIVSRILWLGGLEKSNRNAYNRFIYIHGTAEENRIGTPASYGCVRMRSADVVTLFDRVNIGATVLITKDQLPTHVVQESHSVPASPTPSTNPPIDVTAMSMAGQTASATPSSASPSPPPYTPGTPVKAVPMTLTTDGRVVPADSVKEKPKSGPMRGTQQSNGRQALKIPVGRS